ncbi:hypothetical protein VNI00_010935 [Paramarasmius palmivorus]|uniref:Uncharacterized protein n=1 Tax=Paramarasmius palmivorus TaxID=297713 RepID=A0AAW0CH30_9AGAR
MVMHTDPGCVQSLGVDQGGKTLATDCNSDVGCKVEETKSDSYGEGFAKAGGGVFTLKIDVEGVFMWFWSVGVGFLILASMKLIECPQRRDIPVSISEADSYSAMNLSDWGKPSAAYPAAGCDIENFFKPQKLILDITLCGQWAGIPEVYAETCPGECISNVYGDGSNYATAYWEIAYIRTFSTKALASRAVARDSPTDVGTEFNTSIVVDSAAISASPVSKTDFPVVLPTTSSVTLLDPTAPVFSPTTVNDSPSSVAIFDPPISISPSTVTVDDAGPVTVLTTSHLITTIPVTVDITQSDKQHNFPVTSTITPSIEESDTDGHLAVTQISSVLVLTLPITMNATLERVSSTVSSDLGQSTSSFSGSDSSSTISTMAIYVLVLTVFFASQ